MLFAIPDFAPILKGIGALEPIDDFVAELDARHDFVDSAVEAYSYDGGVWAVPLYNMTMHLWYRPSVLEAAGIAVPTTWDEWRAAAEALTVDGQYGMGLPANKQLYTDQTVYSVMLNGGASEIYNEDGTLRFDNPETVEAYDFYNSMMAFSPPDAQVLDLGRGRGLLRLARLRDDHAVHGDLHLRHAGRRRCRRPRRGGDPGEDGRRRTRHHRLRQRGDVPERRRGAAGGVAEASSRSCSSPRTTGGS
jgi:hypothetical protein